MNIQGAVSAEGTVWLVALLEQLEATRTDGATVVRTEPETQTAKATPLTFEQHVAQLPTMDDLVAAARRRHPDFDQHLRAAREAQYKALLKQVRRGAMTRLAAERLRCRLTQAELAEKAGMKQPNISRLEQPGTSMNLATAKRLSDALGLPDYRVLLP